MKASFPSHGECSIEVDGNIMKIQASGPCNLEYFDELRKSLIAASKHINLDHYAVFIQLSGQAVAVEGGLQKHANFIKHSGAKALALDFSRCQTTHISKRLFDKAYSTTGLTFRFFDDPNEALEWLNQELA